MNKGVRKIYFEMTRCSKNCKPENDTDDFINRLYINIYNIEYKFDPSEHTSVPLLKTTLKIVDTMLKKNEYQGYSFELSQNIAEVDDRLIQVSQGGVTH